jgi:outer membrane protein TolC
MMAAMVAATTPALNVVMAQDGHEAVESLTLEQALKLARQRNRSVIAERAKLAQAQASVEQGWSSLFPTVAAQGKYTRNNVEFAFPRPGTTTLLIQPYNQLDGSLSASVPLLTPAAYPALEAVKANAHAADATFEVSEASVLLSVAQMFYAASIADEVMSVRQSSIVVANATFKNAKDRFSAGTVTKVDVDRAELALVRAEQAEREARLGRDTTYRGLATLIQKAEPFKVVTPSEKPQMHDERELEQALKLRPEFRSAELTVKSFDAQRRAQGWRWSPSLSGFGLARVFNYDNFAEKRYSWAFGAQLDWVLFDGGGRDAARHLAAAQATEIAARSEVLRDSIRDDLANGRRQLETKLRGVEVAERSVQLAKETLGLVRLQYSAGTITQVDLLQAQDALVATQEGLAQAHYDVAAADLALRHAAGTFPGK